jgi:hypothetical protein
MVIEYDGSRFSGWQSLIKDARGAAGPLVDCEAGLITREERQKRMGKERAVCVCVCM